MPALSLLMPNRYGVAANQACTSFRPILKTTLFWSTSRKDGINSSRHKEKCLNSKSARSLGVGSRVGERKGEKGNVSKLERTPWSVEESGGQARDPTSVQGFISFFEDTDLRGSRLQGRPAGERGWVGGRSRTSRRTGPFC